MKASKVVSIPLIIAVEYYQVGNEVVQSPNTLGGVQARESCAAWQALEQFGIEFIHQRVAVSGARELLLQAAAYHKRSSSMLSTISVLAHGFSDLLSVQSMLSEQYSGCVHSCLMSRVTCHYYIVLRLNLHSA